MCIFLYVQIYNVLLVLFLRRTLTDRRDEKIFNEEVVRKMLIKTTSQIGKK